MAPEAFKSINYDQPVPDVHAPFTIECPPDTDVWEKPPSVHSFNAPIIYQAMDLVSFKSARVTVSAAWTEKYDQGGLCLIIDPSSTTQRRWVKTGIELLNGEPHVSTVATDRWSDWSLRPMAAHTNGATIEIKSEDDGSLWVYLVAEDGKASPMREVTWWGDLDKSTECWVGVYAAKPAKEQTPLHVNFRDLAVDSSGKV